MHERAFPGTNTALRVGIRYYCVSYFIISSDSLYIYIYISTTPLASYLHFRPVRRSATWSLHSFSSWSM